MSIDRYDAGETGKMSGVFKDSDGVTIPGTSISAITLTLTDSATGAVVNSRSAQDVKGVNNGDLTSGGVFTWAIQPGDTTPLSGASASEHVAEFSATYTSASQAGTQVAKLTHRLICFAGGYALPFCSFQDVEAMLPGVDDTHRLLIELLVDSFTRRVERDTGRLFRRKVGEVEVFSAERGQTTIRAKRWPIESVTSLKESIDGVFSGGDVFDPSEFAVLDEGLIRLRWRRFMEGVGSIQLTYTGGIARDSGTVPSDAKLIAAQQVSHWFQHKDSPGIQSQSVGQGSSQSFGDGDLLPSSIALIKRLTPTYL